MVFPIKMSAITNAGIIVFEENFVKEAIYEGQY
jgi:hypothetical protein